MAGRRQGDGGIGNRPRMVAWGTAACLILLPLVAMQVTDEVNWDLVDFVFATALVVGVGVTFELAVRKTGSRAYRAAAAIALAAAFMLVWGNAAVGVIGSEDHPANLLYGLVPAVAVIGAIIARFRSRPMARAMVATALAQASAPVIALVVGLGASDPIWRAETLMLTAFFAALWLASAWLFRRAAQE